MSFWLTLSTAMQALTDFTDSLTMPPAHFAHSSTSSPRHSPPSSSASLRHRLARIPRALVIDDPLRPSHSATTPLSIPRARPYRRHPVATRSLPRPTTPTFPPSTLTPRSIYPVLKPASTSLRPRRCFRPKINQVRVKEKERRKRTSFPALTLPRLRRLTAARPLPTTLPGSSTFPAKPPTPSQRDAAESSPRTHRQSVPSPTPPFSISNGQVDAPRRRTRKKVYPFAALPTYTPPTNLHPTPLSRTVPPAVSPAPTTAPNQAERVNSRPHSALRLPSTALTL
ncbi:hypothetical protein R3P38DRAFT_3250462 [Favolaschia claudopus]|uniref:Uncharacterized protein n=1 Tax=Favolaschia claudopus TaxID=2862362 RepID=A0AAW0ELK2_9AGAR